MGKRSEVRQYHLEVKLPRGGSQVGPWAIGMVGWDRNRVDGSQAATGGSEVEVRQKDEHEAAVQGLDHNRKSWGRPGSRLDYGRELETGCGRAGSANRKSEPQRPAGGWTRWWLDRSQRKASHTVGERASAVKVTEGPQRKGGSG